MKPAPIPIITTTDINNFLKFYKVDEYLKRFYNHKVWFSFEFKEEERDRSRTNGVLDKSRFWDSRAVLLIW